MRTVGAHTLVFEDTNHALVSGFFVVALILLIGFVVYLRKERYIRRRTGWFTIAVLTLVLVAYAASMSGFRI